MKTSAIPQPWEGEHESTHFKNDGMTILGLIGCVTVTLFVCFFLALRMYAEKIFGKVTPDAASMDRVRQTQEKFRVSSFKLQE